MVLSVIGLLLIFVATCCWAVVLLHAFGRSVGTGVMALFLPPYCLVYAFTQFQHRHKGALLAAWLGGLVSGIVFRTLGYATG